VSLCRIESRKTSKNKTGTMLLFALLFLPAVLWAEPPSASLNAQLHRDFDREIFTSTIEIFESDRWGSAFFFTDFDFDSAGQTGSYFEITRNVRVMHIGKTTGNLSLQYNDGVLSTDAARKGIPRTWLAGVAVSDLMWGTAFFELQALARKEFAADVGWQLTGVWDWPIRGTPLEFLGYVDWWNMGSDGMTAVQTEPQFQVRWNPWAVGSEVEVSRNFSGAWTQRHGFQFDRWYAHPTIYVRVYF
jgi:hypothetical protein